VSTPFEWWLLLVGLGAGAILTWLIVGDIGRRDDDLSAVEREREAERIAAELAARGEPVPIETVDHVLELHRIYLSLPVEEDAEAEPEAAPDEAVAGVADEPEAAPDEAAAGVADAVALAPSPATEAAPTPATEAAPDEAVVSPGRRPRATRRSQGRGADSGSP